MLAVVQPQEHRASAERIHQPVDQRAAGLLGHPHRRRHGLRDQRRGVEWGKLHEHELLLQLRPEVPDGFHCQPGLAHASGPDQGQQAFRAQKPHHGVELPLTSDKAGQRSRQGRCAHVRCVAEVSTRASLAGHSQQPGPRISAQVECRAQALNSVRIGGPPRPTLQILNAAAAESGALSQLLLGQTRRHPVLALRVEAGRSLGSRYESVDKYTRPGNPCPKVPGIGDTVR